VLAATTVFAIELSRTQASSKSAIKVEVHQRAALAGALIGSLLQSVQQQVPQDSKIYGSATVSDQTLNMPGQQSGYLAVLDSGGRVLASSTGFTAQVRAGLPISGALAMIRSGHPYGLGNLAPYGSAKLIDFGISFPTPYGPRILLTGIDLGALNSLLTGDLHNIPGVKGAHNYLVDGNDAVLATSNPAAAVGHLIPGAGAVQALRHASGDVQGHYFEQVAVANTTWRILLVAPDGPLFASVTGLHQLVPWLIFAAFAIVALAALALGRRVLADQLRSVNKRLEAVNGELTEVNAKLGRRAAELARSNEELDQFASIASHDLQEPLRKVRTFTEQLTLTEGEHLSENGRDYLLRANSAAERMQKLIEDLLRFSRVTTQGRPFSPVDLSEITEAVLVELDVLVEASAAVIHVGALPTVNADALQMRQLMQNLISNALKFHREGVAPEITIAADGTDDEVQLTVRDNGIGFEARYSLRIFRVFERLHGRSEYPGTGIGLALCRKIAERHGGSIVAEGRPGVGSTFTVTLPRHQSGEIVPDLPFDIDDAELSRKETSAHA
jgi:signal transduction histidine kinase